MFEEEVIVPLKWQYIANKLNALKQNMFKQPMTEYPNHGTMTENWVGMNTEISW